ncbi:hypothetical protein RFM98_29715, partial [Mesorhizobium sp. VK9D]
RAVADDPLLAAGTMRKQSDKISLTSARHESRVFLAQHFGSQRPAAAAAALSSAVISRSV